MANPDRLNSSVALIGISRVGQHALDELIGLVGFVGHTYSGGVKRVGVCKVLLPLSEANIEEI